MSLMPREELIASLPNTVTFEKQPVLLRKFMELFSLSGPENTWIEEKAPTWLSTQSKTPEPHFAVSLPQ